MPRLAPRWPKRRADQTSAQKAREVHDPSLRDVNSLTARTAAIRRAASSLRPLTASGRGGHHASASVTAIRAPEKSPSHQVLATWGSESAVSAPPASSESGPTVAL